MTYEELTALGWTADSESEMAQELSLISIPLQPFPMVTRKYILIL